MQYCPWGQYCPRGGNIALGGNIAPGAYFAYMFEMLLLIFAVFLKAPDHETYTKMCAQDVAFTAQSISSMELHGTPWKPWNSMEFHGIH